MKAKSLYLILVFSLVFSLTAITSVSVKPPKTAEAQSDQWFWGCTIVGYGDNPDAAVDESNSINARISRNGCRILEVRLAIRFLIQGFPIQVA